ncbi:MAG: hydroxymethylbilane synthase [Actinomycetia bacterium]|nr:hydroxymethylbilane synthase [Actinomycetes bacterium]
MTGAVLRVGTRASALARAQTAQTIAPLGAGVEIVPVVTHGDRSAAPLARLGGTGVFVSALRDALLGGLIDVAVHSFKDLPTEPAAGVALAAVPPREDPRDALVARDGLTLAELPAGARVGTGSPRRAAQLLAARADLAVVAVRGNVDTRLGKVGGELDAVLLALAGLTRLGRADAVTDLLDPLSFLPAPAQGALAIECRSDDAATRVALARLDHPDTRAAACAERAVLAGLRAGCTAPVGALATVLAAPADRRLVLNGSVTRPDGGFAVTGSATGPITDAEAIGRRLAADLLARGADTILGRLP